MKQCTGFTAQFDEFLRNTALQVTCSAEDTLAVHLRLTDKVDEEAKANALLTNESVVIHVRPGDSSRRLIAGDYIRW